MRKLTSAATAAGLLFAGSALAQLPGYTHSDLPQRYGPTGNVSDDYVVLDHYTAENDSLSGTPGIYRQADLASGVYTPVVALQYAQVDNGTPTGAVYGVVPLSNGDYVLPNQIAGDYVYGVAVRPEGVQSSAYRCDLDTLAASPDTSCVSLPDFRIPSWALARSASAAGYAMLQNLNTLALSLRAPSSHAQPGTELANFPASGQLLRELRATAGSDRGVGLLRGSAQAEAFSGGGLLAFDESEGQYFTTSFVSRGNLPADTADAALAPVAVSPLDIPWLGSDQVRVLFSYRSNDYSATAGPEDQLAQLWIADFQLDFVGESATLVPGTEVQLTGLVESEQALRAWDYSSRITEQGVLVTLVGSASTAGETEVALVDTTAAGIANGAGIQRVNTLFPGAAASASNIHLAVNDCGNVYYTTYATDAAGVTDPSSVNLEALFSDACPAGSGPTSNTVTVDGPDATIDPAQTATISVPILLDSVSLHGIDMTCSADPSVLTLVSGSLSDFYPADALVVGPTQTGNSWHVAVAPQGTSDPVTGSGEFAVLEFAVPFVTATTEIVCEVSASDGAGNPIDVSSVSATVAVDDGIHGGSGSLSGQVTLPVGSDHSGITVVIHRNGYSYSAVTDASGNYLFTGLRDATFSLTFNHDNYVSDCMQAVVSGGSATSVPAVSMIGGDITNDGVIDIGDFTVLANAYGTLAGEADYVPEADLNADNAINVQDLSILGSHFGLDMCSPDDFASACGFDALDSGAIASAAGTELTLEGMSATTTATSDLITPAMAGFVADTPSAATGVTYMEYTYTSADALDAATYGVLGFLHDSTAGSDGVGVAVYPQSGQVVTMSGEVLLSGLSIEPGYTVGLAYNHDTGVVQIQDSLGNTATTTGTYTGIPMYAAIGGQPAAGAGNSLTGTLRVNDGTYVLTPPSGSSDWCGQSL